MKLKIMVRSIFICSIIFTNVTYGYPAQYTQIGRYQTIKNEPTLAQVDLLSQPIQIHFPQNIKTVGDAMQHMLIFSGYTLVDESKRNASLKTILSKPLPVVDRTLGPMPLKLALLTLTGPSFYLQEDPINREVNFHLKSTQKINREKK